MVAGDAQADRGRFREFPRLRGLERRAARHLQWCVACGGAMESKNLELQQEDGGEHQMGARGS